MSRVEPDTNVPHATPSPRVLGYRTPPPPVQKLYLYGVMPIMFGTVSLAATVFLMLICGPRGSLPRGPESVIVFGGLAYVISPLAAVAGLLCGTVSMANAHSRGPQTIVGMFLSAGCLMALGWLVS